MANRTMQQKEVKLRKQKRLSKKYRTDYVHINIPRKPDFHGNPSPTMYMRGTTSMEEASKRLQDAQLEAMFPSLFGHATNSPRKEALARSRLLKELEGVPLERHVVLKRTIHRKIMLCFEDTRTKFYIVEVNRVAGFLQRSVNYGSRDRALSAYKNKNVLWKRPWFYEKELEFPSG